MAALDPSSWLLTKTMALSLQLKLLRIMIHKALLQKLPFSGHHEHIIKYYESFYDSKGHLNIVMQFADWGTMQDSVEQTRVRTEEYCIWRVIRHISNALKYLHTLNPKHVIHRTEISNQPMS